MSTEKQHELHLPMRQQRTRAECMADRAEERAALGLVRCVVYIPAANKVRLSKYVVGRLSGEYAPKK